MSAMETLVDRGWSDTSASSNFSLDQLRGAQAVMRKYPLSPTRSYTTSTAGRLSEICCPTA
jgi:hypothetical protein